MMLCSLKKTYKYSLQYKLLILRVYFKVCFHKLKKDLQQVFD